MNFQCKLATYLRNRIRGQPMWHLLLAIVLVLTPAAFAQDAPAQGVAPATDETVGSVDSEAANSDLGLESDSEVMETSEPVDTRQLFPPQNVIARDVPSDDGGSISITWDPPLGDIKPNKYVLEMKMLGEGVFTPVTQTLLREYAVPQLKNWTPYQFRVTALYDGAERLSEVTPEVIPMDHWVKSDKLPVYITILIYTCILLVFIQAARRGVELFVRRISGLNAVEDAIGRATEMGKPVLYVPGTSSIEDVATLAALNILGEVARRTVHYDVKIICPNRDPIVYTIAREIVKETYASEGRPDAFDPDSVFFMVPDQFAYAAGVDGIMVREKPATIFLMGMFWAESLIMAETGASTGAIQIAGTDSPSQLPFFITACDYTLIGEELYAASAYLGREPLLLGTLKSQDYGKLLFIIVMILFSILSLFGVDAISLIQVR